MFTLLTRSSNVTDVFKTPGKLRGKTPRTARKRNLEEARMVGKAMLTRRRQANDSVAFE